MIAVGASMVAFIAAGTFRDYDDAIAHMVQEKDVFRPNEATHNLYLAYYNKAYRHLSGKLKGVNKNIVKLLKRRSSV